MRKRIICVMLCVVLLCSSFCVTAFAASDVGFWDFVLSAYADIYYINGVANDPNKLVDYWDTYPGKAEILSRLFFGVGAPQDVFTFVPKIMAVKNLDAASDARYMVAELEKEQLEALYDSFNDYWSNNTAEIRNVSFNDIDITFNLNTSVHGSFGYISGSGDAARYNSDNYYLRFNSGYGSTSNFDSNTIYVYNGSMYYPPVIYIPSQNLAYQSGNALPIGFYYVLNGTQLLYAGSGYSAYEMYIAYSTDNNNYLQDFYAYRGRRQTLFVYQGGKRYTIGKSTDTLNFDYEFDDALSMYSMSVGFHVTTDDHLDSLTIDVPENIPYDDNKTVVMLPVDEPGEPVYMSPTEYNNYVNNGDIYNTDDHSNNIVNGDTVNNITNIYNTYITNNNSDGGYDDSQVLTKLDIIIEYLKKIYKKIKGKTNNTDIKFDIGDLLGVDDLFDRDSVELDWKTLVQTKLPLLAEAAEVVRKFESAESPLSIESDVPLPAGDSNKTIHFALDFTWYDKNEYAGKTGREYVREGLSYIIYVAAFVALYRRTDMLFADY